MDRNIDKIVIDLTVIQQDVFNEIMTLLGNKYSVQNNIVNYILFNGTLGWNHDICACFRVIRTSGVNEYDNKKPDMYLNYTDICSKISTVKPNDYYWISDIPYHMIWQTLNNFGSDLIESTKEGSKIIIYNRLKYHLERLNNILQEFEISSSDLFTEMVYFIMLLNLNPQTKNRTLMQLLGILSYKCWEEIEEETKIMFLQSFDYEYIMAISVNNFFRHFTSMNKTEYAIKCGYLYSVFKMLFLLFGMNKITPTFMNIKNNYGYLFNLDHPINKMIDFDSNIKFYQIVEAYYPHIFGFIGGVNAIPLDNTYYESGDNIPNNYNNLSSLIEFLWRFNDSSYYSFINMKYISQINELTNNVLSNRIESKIKQLTKI